MDPSPVRPSKEYIIDPSVFESAKAKHVLVTGGASGVGAEAVRLFADAGAKVTIADIDTAKGSALAEKLTGQGTQVYFHKTDISHFGDLESLFQASTSALGAPDLICANAGIHDEEDWFSEDFLATEHHWKSAHVNFVGTLNTIQLSLLSFRRAKKPGSIVITGSFSGYTDTTPVCAYGGGKHALVGLLRSFATVAPTYGVSITLVAPAMIDTPFAGPALKMFQDMGLPINSARRVAEAIAFLGLSDDMNGSGAFLVDGRLFEAEEGYHAFRKYWLGEEVTNLLDVSSNPVVQLFRKGGESAKLH